MFVVSTIALMVGLGAEMARLAPFAYETGMMRPRHWPSGGGCAAITAMPNQDLGAGPTLSPVTA